MTKSLADFFDLTENQERFKMVPNDLVDSTYCVALYTDYLWYRAFITQTLSPTSCKVFFIDYGNSMTVSFSEMRFLPKQYSQLPAFAFAACLENVYVDGHDIRGKSKLVFHELVIGEQRSVQYLGRIKYLGMERLVLRIKIRHHSLLSKLFCSSRQQYFSKIMMLSRHTSIL